MVNPSIFWKFIQWIAEHLLIKCLICIRDAKDKYVYSAHKPLEKYTFVFFCFKQSVASAGMVVGVHMLWIGNWLGTASQIR
jgi:hypothetical protein